MPQPPAKAPVDKNCEFVLRADFTSTYAYHLCEAEQQDDPDHSDSGSEYEKANKANDLAEYDDAEALTA